VLDLCKSRSSVRHLCANANVCALVAALSSQLTCPYLHPLIHTRGDTADAFADAANQEEDTSGIDYVHVRVQQRNGRKSLTTVQGLKPTYDKKKVLKALKKGG
jgi:hypothetical protein